jgi:hypothetical protein
MKYYNNKRASSYMCHRLRPYLSNVPEDRKVSPKQRTCLKDHPPRFEQFVLHWTLQLWAQKLSCKIWLWLLQKANNSLWSFWHSSLGSLDGSSPLTKSATCGVPWQTQSFQNLMNSVYWIHQINLYWSSACPNISLRASLSSSNVADRILLLHAKLDLLW